MIQQYFYPILLLSIHITTPSDHQNDMEQLIQDSLKNPQFLDYNWQNAAQKVPDMPMTIGLELYENKSFVQLVDIITLHTKNKDIGLKSIFSSDEIKYLYESTSLPEQKMMHRILGITVQKVAKKKGL